MTCLPQVKISTKTKEDLRKLPKLQTHLDRSHSTSAEDDHFWISVALTVFPFVPPSGQILHF